VTDTVQKGFELDKATLGKILTVGEACLSHEQFRAFKRLVQDHFYGPRRTQLLAILHGSDQARGYAHVSAIQGRKGGAP